MHHTENITGENFHQALVRVPLYCRNIDVCQCSKRPQAWYITILSIQEKNFTDKIFANIIKVGGEKKLARLFPSENFWLYDLYRKTKLTK